MAEEIAAICGSCNESTQKIYGSYECADCYIEELEDALKGNKDYNNQAVSTLEQSVEYYKQQIEDQADLLSYKVAYEKLVAELLKNK